jgi:hypothetical protein
MYRFSRFNRIAAEFNVSLLLAAILCAGTAANTAADNIAGQSPTGKVVRGEHFADDDENSKTNSNDASVRKFLSSLRFWEKEKKPAVKKTAAVTIAPVSPVAQSAAASSSKTPPSSLLGSQSAGKTPAANYTAASNAAPVPPQIPQLEQQRANLTEIRVDTGTTDTIIPSEMPEMAKKDSVSSTYTFDSREWVDSYPVRQSPPPAVTYPAAPKEKPAAVSPPSDNWNGETVALASAQSVSPKKTLAGPAGVVSMDLTPSYKKQLPYTEVYGVVVVQADFPLTEIASISAEIQQLQYDLHKYVGVPAPKEKIELCLFKNEAAYINFLKRNFPNAPLDRRALFVKSDNKPATLMLQKADNFIVDLRHEMTHAIVHSSIENVPIWLDEGLAKYFELPAEERAEKNPYLKRVRWGVKFGAVPSLTRLTKLETIEDMGAKEYQDSWAWTHFLIHRNPQTHQLLAGYLQMLGSGGQRQNKRIQPITPYINDIIPNPREEFRSHFGAED